MFTSGLPRIQLRQQSCLYFIYIYFQLSHKLYHSINLMRNCISIPSTSKIRVTVFIDGFPAPRSISFTVAKLMPAISAKSNWDIPKTPRRSLTTSLRFIKVYYNQLLAAKINIFFYSAKKSLINYTFYVTIVSPAALAEQPISRSKSSMGLPVSHSRTRS